MKIQGIHEYLTNRLPRLNIAVIGDSIVDRYIFGDVDRISPEAPVPVNLVKHITEVLGGAANVANNLAKLDCHVFLGSVAGKDAQAERLKCMLAESGIDYAGLIYSAHRQTTTKIRVLGNLLQMMRLDYEAFFDCNESEKGQLLVWLDRLIDEHLDGLVISDYGKGLCTQQLLAAVMKRARIAGIPIIVDPKGTDWQKYNGATCITPNVKELGEAVGYALANMDEVVVTAAKSVLEQVDLEFIVTTRSEKGITVVHRDGYIWHSPATQQDVFDVSGAGDTVVAMMITAIASGLSMRTSLLVANAAAGIVVSKVGTYPIHRAELLDLWENVRNHKPRMPIIYSYDEMAALVRKWQDAGEVVVFSNGCFDILHSGHIAYLQEAATLGARLIVAVNSDESVKRLKGEDRPINKESDRAFMMSALRFVDGVVIFEEDTPRKLLAKIRPNILVKGGDYKVDEVIGRESVDEVRILSFKQGYSTTGIINKIKRLVEDGKL